MFFEKNKKFWQNLPIEYWLYVYLVQICMSFSENLNFMFKLY